jgi:hypothetical protein
LGQHLRIAQYELNPLWQSSIGRTRWFNLPHLLAVALVAYILLYIADGASATGDGDQSLQVLLGLAIIVYSMVVGRHISNILNAVYSIRHPDEITGRVEFSHKMGLRMSQHQILTVFVPFVAAYVATRSPFVLGGVCGLAILPVVHVIWLMVHKIRAKPGARAG